MDVHVRDLRYFVAVAEELHFTRAAERLFVSQPALSKQIRALEEQLRVELFVRDRRNVSLTPAGEALLPAARELIAVWDAAQQAVADAAAAAAAVLRIGFSTSVGRGLLPRIQQHFARVRPNWRLQLRQVDWDDPTGGLRDGTSDLAIVWLPVPAADRFSQLVLVEEPRHVALRAEHPLAGRREIEFAALLDEPFLALPEDAGSPRDYLARRRAPRRPPPAHRRDRDQCRGDLRSGARRARGGAAVRRQRRDLSASRRRDRAGPRHLTQPAGAALARR